MRMGTIAWLKAWRPHVASAWVPSEVVACVPGKLNHAKAVEMGTKFVGNGMIGWSTPVQ